MQVQEHPKLLCHSAAPVLRVLTVGKQSKSGPGGPTRRIISEQTDKNEQEHLIASRASLPSRKDEDPKQLLTRSHCCISLPKDDVHHGGGTTGTSEQP